MLSTSSFLPAFALALAGPACAADRLSEQELKTAAALRDGARAAPAR